MTTEPTPSDELGYLDYVREAFNFSPRLKMIGNLPLNWMGIAAFATLGLLNPGFWLIGAGLEVAWLASASSHPRFRNFVRGKRLVAARQSATQTAEQREATLLAQLVDEDAARYVQFVSRLEKAQAMQTTAGKVSNVMADVTEEGLYKLRWLHLRLLSSMDALRRQIDPTVRKELQKELDETVRRIEALGPNDERLRHSLESTMEIVRQRIKNLDGAEANLRYIGSELRRIEHQAELIIEEAALADDPDTLTKRIDAVTSTFGETQEWMRLHRELLADVEDDLDDRPPPRRVPEG